MASRGERQARMYEMRESTAYSPTSQEIESHIANFLLPYRQQLHDAATLHKEVFISQLGDVKAKGIKDSGRQLSRLAVCAAAIENSVQMSIENIAFNLYGKGNVQEFAFWSDVAQGIYMVKIPLVLGEEHIREHAEEVIQKARQETEDFKGEGIPIPQAAQGYLIMQTEAEESARILMIDPSGVTLARTAVEWVKQPPMPGRMERIFPSNRTPAYVIAGAEIGLLAHELMYPLTERLP